MRTRNALLTTLFAAACLHACAQAPPVPDPVPVEAEPKVPATHLAQLGDDIIYTSSLSDQLALEKIRTGASAALTLEVAREHLDTLIWQHVVMRDATAMELVADDDAIDALIERIAGAAGDDDIKRTLESHGVPFDDYRAFIRIQISGQRVFWAHTRELDLSDDALAKKYGAQGEVDHDALRRRGMDDAMKTWRRDKIEGSGAVIFEENLKAFVEEQGQ